MIPGSQLGAAARSAGYWTLMPGATSLCAPYVDRASPQLGFRCHTFVVPSTCLWCWQCVRVAHLELSGWASFAFRARNSPAPRRHG